MPDRPRYEPEDITQEVVDTIEIGSTWLDIMALELRGAVRYAEIVSVKEHSRPGGPSLWLLHCRESQGFQRSFTMYVHGFLSRYELRHRPSPEQD